MMLKFSVVSFLPRHENVLNAAAPCNGRKFTLACSAIERTAAIAVNLTICYQQQTRETIMYTNKKL